jgi:NADPH:quinone reductase-like Zn-dependent oxidoreductase
MKAIAVDDFNEEPHLMDLPDPKPGPGEIVVAIGAAAINPIDWKAAQGAFRTMMEPSSRSFSASTVPAASRHSVRAPIGSAAATSSTASSGAGRLRHVTEAVAAGQLVIPVQDEVALRDGAAAIARNRAGGARGKTLIRI